MSHVRYQHLMIKHQATHNHLLGKSSFILLTSEIFCEKMDIKIKEIIILYT
jgi:hypothetical protein